MGEAEPGRAHSVSSREDPLRRSSLDDRELMLRARGGSRAAFSVLVERYEARLISFFHRHGGDPDLAEDCAQEVFVRLYRARERYGPSASFATFLFTIARNYWIDVVRSRRARPLESSLSVQERDGERREEGELVAAEQAGPAEMAEKAEDLERLQRALRHLPDGQQDVIMLGVIEALPYADVSNILHIPVGTVKSRVHAAVRSLRQWIREDAAQGKASSERVR